MGTVAINDKLKSEIRLNVCRPFNERYRAAAKLSIEESHRLYKALLVTPEQESLMLALPSNWVNLSRTEHLRNMLFIAHAPDGKADRKVNWLELQLPPNVPFYYSYAWAYEPPSSHGDRIEGVHHSWLVFDLSATCLQLFGRDPITELDRITTERDQSVKTVIKMLDGCKTLNQVEKIWPAIRKYVSNETVQRLNHRPKRVTAADAGINQDELNALSVHHIRTQMTA